MDPTIYLTRRQNLSMSLLLCIFLFLCVRPTSCSDNGDLSDTPHVFSGEPIGKDEYEWFCAIRRKKDLSFVCSASLIGSRFVITTQHCIENENGLEVEVGYLCRNRDNCGRGTAFVDVEKVFRHAEGGDMALIVLKRPIKIDVLPAVPYLGPDYNADVEPVAKGRRMKLVGLGRIPGRDGRVSHRVREVSVRSVKRKKCTNWLKKSKRVARFTTCSVALDDDTCVVDVGGAVVVRGTGEWKDRDVILGIHSLGYRGCAKANKRKHPLGHFNLVYGADLLRQVVCEGDYGPPEDWCERPPPRVELQHTLPRAHGLNVYSVAFNKDGSRLVSGGTGTRSDGDFLNGIVLLWDPIAGGSPLAKGAMKDSTWVEAVGIHPTDSSLVVSTTFDRALNLWTIDENEELTFTETLIEGDPDDCCSPFLVVAWNHADGTLASNPKGSSIVILDPLANERGNETKSFEAGGTIRSLAFNKAGTLLASSGDDKTIRIWRTDTFALVTTLKAPGPFECGMSFSPNDKFLAATCGNDNGVIRVWEAESGKRLRSLSGQPRAQTLAWSPDSTYLVSGGASSELRIFDVVKGGSPLLVVDTDESTVRDVDWSPDGTQIVAAMEKRGFAEMKIWNVKIFKG